MLGLLATSARARGSAPPGSRPPSRVSSCRRSTRAGGLLSGTMTVTTDLFGRDIVTSGGLASGAADKTQLCSRMPTRPESTTLATRRSCCAPRSSRSFATAMATTAASASRCRGRCQTSASSTWCSGPFDTCDSNASILHRIIAILWSSLAHENIDMALVIKY